MSSNCYPRWPLCLPWAEQTEENDPGVSKFPSTATGQTSCLLAKREEEIWLSTPRTCLSNDPFNAFGFCLLAIFAADQLSGLKSKRACDSLQGFASKSAEKGHPPCSFLRFPHPKISLSPCQECAWSEPAHSGYVPLFLLGAHPHCGSAGAHAPVEVRKPANASQPPLWSHSLPVQQVWPRPKTEYFGLWRKHALFPLMASPVWREIDWPLLLCQR